MDNNGIGAWYAILKIANENGVFDLTEKNVGDAVTMAGDEVTLGRLNEKLLGRLEHVSVDCATVQIAGVARFRYQIAPDYMGSVVVDGSGSVLNADGTTISGLPISTRHARGTVIHIDHENKTCDILL